MYTVWSNVKFYFGIVCWFLITIAMFLVGWGMSFTSVDLSMAPKTIGLVSSISIKPTSAGRAGNVNALVFQVDYDPAGYWIYRASGSYSNISDSIPVGTKVTIYHNGNIQSNGLYTVYQLEDKSHVVYSKDEYERREKLGGRLIVLPGAFVLLIVIFYQIKKRRRLGVSNKSLES